jgi:hypothetical protein
MMFPNGLKMVPSASPLVEIRGVAPAQALIAFGQMALRRKLAALNAQCRCQAQR